MACSPGAERQWRSEVQGQPTSGRAWAEVGCPQGHPWPLETQCGTLISRLRSRRSPPPVLQASSKDSRVTPGSVPPITLGPAKERSRDKMEKKAPGEEVRRGDRALAEGSLEVSGEWHSEQPSGAGSPRLRKLPELQA